MDSADLIGGEPTGPSGWSFQDIGRFGRIGSAGQARTKTFATRAAAKTYAEKLIAEKTGKGYQEGSRVE